VSQPGDLEARVTALEAQVRELADRVRHSQQDAAAARVLAGGADRDVAEMRGDIREFREQNTRVLNAMRQDLTDLRSRVDDGFARVDEQFARVDERFARVDNGFAEMRGKLDGTSAGLQQIAGLLTTLIAQRGDERAGRAPA
jgi:DNA anti-recombination protein RmuC